jgi:Zn-dependent oligopeptidase
MRRFCSRPASRAVRAAARCSPRRRLVHAEASLFALPGLSTPADCERIASAAERHCAVLVARVAQGASAPAVSVLHDLDSLSSTVCRVLDAFELARNVHPDPAFVRAAVDAYNQLGGVLRELNTDSRLHEAVCAVLTTPAVASELGSEELRFAQAMRAEFEHDGAHLPASHRAKLQTLQAQAESAAWAFETGVSSERGVGVWLPGEAVAALPASLRAALPRCAGCPRRRPGTPSAAPLSARPRSCAGVAIRCSWPARPGC